MRKTLVKTGALVLIIASCIVVHAMAAGLSSIPPQGTVYLGEEGLDISLAAGGNQVAWFPSTSQTGSQNPEKQIDITSTKLSFYINPLDFSTRTGNWYQWPSTDGTIATAVLAFRVVDPYVALKIEDTTVSVDVTGKWAPRGDELKFRIESNLGDMTGRGVAGAPVTIKVQTPEGAILSSLINKAGTYNSLDISVTKSPEFTLWTWDTGNLQYNSGTYVIWAECNANRMKDNYNQEGKTYSVKGNLLVQDQNPLISANVPATTPITQVTTRQTTKLTTAVTTKLPTIVPTITTAITPPITSQEIPEQTVTLSPPPTPTKAAGFCGWCTPLAGIIACGLYALWRR